MRQGGRRKDRVFKLHIEVPTDMDEDSLMDFIEASLLVTFGTMRDDHPFKRIDPFTIAIKRNYPKYKDM